MTRTDVPRVSASDTRAGTSWKLVAAVLAVIVVVLAVILMISTGVLGGPSDVEAVAVDFGDAWAALDGDAVAAFFPEDGRIEFLDGSAAIVGRDAIADFVAETPSIATVEFGDRVTDGRFVAGPYSWDLDGSGTADYSGVSIVRVVGDQVTIQYIVGRSR